MATTSPFPLERAVTPSGSGTQGQVNDEVHPCGWSGRPDAEGRLSLAPDRAWHAPRELPGGDDARPLPTWWRRGSDVVNTSVWVCPSHHAVPSVDVGPLPSPGTWPAPRSIPASAGHVRGREPRCPGVDHPPTGAPPSPCALAGLVTASTNADPHPGYVTDAGWRGSGLVIGEGPTQVTAQLTPRCGMPCACTSSGMRESSGRPQPEHAPRKRY